MIAVAGGINCTLQKCYAIEDISGLKVTWTKALVTLDSATRSFIKWAKLLQNYLSSISISNQQRNTNLHQLKHISLGYLEHDSGPKGAAGWPIPTREMPDITIYQCEKGFCRSHTFADVSWWALPLCREIPFGVVCCSASWFRCRLSIPWPGSALEWPDGALRPWRSADGWKTAFFQGTLDRLNPKFCRIVVGAGQNCYRYCYCCRSISVGRTEGITRMIHSPCVI